MYLLKVFSSKKKKEENEEISNHTKSGRKGAALAAAGIAANTALGLNLLSKKGGANNEDKKAAEAVLREAKKGNPKVVFDKIEDGLRSGYDPRKNIIQSNHNPAILAHEAGHGYYGPHGKGKGIGKLAHKGYAALGGTRGSSLAAKHSGIVAGIASGVRAAELEKQGKKQSKLERHASWAVPVAVSTPMLVAEGMASRHGLGLMKKAGVSKKLRQEGRKQLAKAWGTYGTGTAVNAGLGEASRGVSYRVTKAINGDDNSNKKKKEK